MIGRCVGLLASVIVAASAVADPVSAQTGQSGTSDASGRVLTRVVVTMNEPGAYGRPVSALTFLVVSDDGDRIAIKTNEAGVATAWLPAGDYRLVTPDPLNWEGRAYTWDRMIAVHAGMEPVLLTQDDARSISVAAPGRKTMSRTSEPVALSSRPTPWKSAAPPTEDLTRAPVKPVASKSSAASAMKSNPAPKAAPAPRRKLREGFWLNIGSGYGALSCPHCSGDPESPAGYSGGLSFGGTINPHLLLGIGTTSWYRSENGISLIAGTMDARIRIYPSSTRGFFLTGGIGVGTVGSDLAQLGSDSQFGGGGVVGLGWDMRVSKNMSVTPFWNGFGVATYAADASVSQIGLGLTFH